MLKELMTEMVSKPKKSTIAVESSFEQLSSEIGNLIPKGDYLSYNVPFLGLDCRLCSMGLNHNGKN